MASSAVSPRQKKSCLKITTNSLHSLRLLPVGSPAGPSSFTNHEKLRKSILNANKTICRTSDQNKRAVRMQRVFRGESRNLLQTYSNPFTFPNPITSCISSSTTKHSKSSTSSNNGLISFSRVISVPAVRVRKLGITINVFPLYFPFR